MNEPKLTLQDLKDIRWRWLRPETALLAHDHKQLKLVFDALLASQTALRSAKQDLIRGTVSGALNHIEAALLDQGESDANK